MKPFHEILRDDCKALKLSSPLLLSITNPVAMELTANVLLALGSSPLISSEPEDIEELVSSSISLSVNIGCLNPGQATAIIKGVIQAQKSKIPWVFDPAGVGLSSYRRNFAMELLKYSPSIIRGNASEIMTLAGISNQARGMDSFVESSEALLHGAFLASKYGTVVFISGQTDYIVDSSHAVAIHGGDPKMTRITAMGCSLSAVASAFATVSLSHFSAAVSASLLYASAGSIAGRMNDGIGSMSNAFLDLISTEEAEKHAHKVKIEVIDVNNIK